MSALSLVLIVAVFTCMITNTESFIQGSSSRLTRTNMRMGIQDYSNTLAELFASPAAKYNGELIDKSLKLVEKAAKADGYVYGAVAEDGTVGLALGLIIVVGFAAVVPYFLSVGETALKQQRGFEDQDRTTKNQFSIKRQAAVAKAVATPAVKAAPAKKAAPVVKAAPEKKAAAKNPFAKKAAPVAVIKAAPVKVVAEKKGGFKNPFAKAEKKVAPVVAAPVKVAAKKGGVKNPFAKK